MGFLGLLPRLYGMAREGTCLQKALVATALTVAAKERLDPRLAVLSRVHYQATLKSTNECLGDPIRAVSDEVLGTIELLRFRESFTFVFAEPESSTIAKHIRGGCALLKIRGPAVAQTEEGACLFMAFSVHGLAESLMSRKDLYPFLKGYAKSISISRPIMLSHSAMLLVPAILQRFDKVTVGSTDTSEAQEELLAIILNSANVDSKMLSGLCEVPHGWTPETIALPPGFELPRPAPDSRFLPGLFRPYFRYYKHATACTGYLFLLIGRLYLQRLQLDCYALLHASTKNSMAFNPMADCVDTINSCVGEFTESMAFLEGYHISQQNTASDGTGRTQLRLENHSTGEPDMASIGGWCVPWMVGEVSNQAKDDLEDSLARRVKEWVQYCQDLLKRRRAFWDVVDGV
ncbi:MAG: hypothetical protein M1814_003786 [Vezdaea aestivalis]|nr:MAG: hypothetical protein M1814_003786 [Vezdaea aestivalis]